MISIALAGEYPYTQRTYPAFTANHCLKRAKQTAVSTDRSLSALQITTQET